MANPHRLQGDDGSKDKEESEQEESEEEGSEDDDNEEILGWVLSTCMDANGCY